MSSRIALNRITSPRPPMDWHDYVVLSIINEINSRNYASDPETALHKRDLGIGFIQKPFVPSALRRIVRKSLDAPLHTA